MESESTKRSSETDANESGDETRQAPPKRRRFELNNENEAASWELTEPMKLYIEKYIATHVQEKDLKEQVYSEHPVPANLKKVPELDSYMKTLLQDNSRYQTLKFEKTLKHLNDKIQAVYGPVSKIWAAFEEEKENCSEEELEEGREIAQCFEQAIMLLGQVSNSVMYYRRENVLSTLIESSAQIKEILRNQSKDMNDQSNSSLFGETFETKLIKDSKALKKSEAFFTALKKPAKTQSSSATAASSNQPNRRGSLLRGGRSRGSSHLELLGKTHRRRS
ncbi:uncharacterized protein [Clytia hemisphaerica]|uniref:uncharacterized protein n=1 Tax=Clytia hemisphaerica TaxID=252671 RepID=UPI0034D6EC6B